mgnify:CR=1 FL=1
MNVVFSLILLAAALGCIVFLLTRRENARRSQYGPSGLSGWTSTARTMSSPTSAAVRTMAVSCSI